MLYTKAEATASTVSMFIVDYCCCALPVYFILLGLLPIATHFWYSKMIMINMYPARYSISYYLSHFLMNDRAKCNFIQFSTEISVPFDQTTFFGFYTLLLAQFISSALYLALYTAALALHIGYNVYVQAFVEDLQTMFVEIDEKAVRVMTVDAIELKAILRDAIKFHNQIMG